MAITDLTGTKWLLNETITKAPAGYDLVGYHGDDRYYINFISDSVVYEYIRFMSDESHTGGAIAYSEDGLAPSLAPYRAYSMVWYNGGSSSPYRTIEITGGTDATNTTLISWFEENGALVPPPPPTPSIADKLLQLNQIKQDIKMAIKNKDVDMTGVDFGGYAEKIDEIQTGGGGGYTLTIEFVGGMTLSNLIVEQASGSEFRASFVESCLFEGVTYIQIDELPYDTDLYGITTPEIYAGKTLTNDVQIIVND